MQNQRANFSQSNVIKFSEIGQTMSALPIEGANINYSYPIISNSIKNGNGTDHSTEAAPAQKSKKKRESASDDAKATTTTMIRPEFDKNKTLPEFRKELIAIYALSANLNNDVAKYHGKIQEAAVKGLARILGVRRAYFDDATPEANRILFDELYQTCRSNGAKGRTSKTTEFHLLSRLLRGSDRKQASADAKVLIYAHNEGVTEKEFGEWVKKHRGLDNIRNEIKAQEKSIKNTNQVNNNQKICARLKQATQAAIEARSWSSTIMTIDIEDFPESTKALLSETKWQPMLAVLRDGECHFFTLSDKNAAPTAGNAEPKTDGNDETSEG